ncbi:hypothetical protein [Henriciella aquimarina]|uniref:hypothetical protein n=1 Tax=Henriciella aquimarina TaxID=545261 RepID=UPI0009FEF59A|nr:hypothetical protein [Henriciella aquimarina]
MNSTSKTRREEGNRTIRILLYAATCAAIVAAAGLGLSLILEQSRIADIERGALTTAEARDLIGTGQSPALLLAAADSLRLQEQDDIETARTLTAEALERQPAQPVAWARLAYYEAALAGGLNEEALSALQTSIRQCGYCDKDLMRWRLGFILNHWADTPEAVRLDVFRGAEFLRWWHIDGAFLAEAHQKANGLGIPFREYQKAVVTSVRPQEVLN